MASPSKPVVTTDQNDLLGFVSSLKGGDGLRVEETLGSGYVRLRVSEAERRQAKHDIRCVEDAVIEMLRNARDADAQRIFVASWREGDVRSIVMVDDGVGIPPSMHDRVFDARVTSKLDTVHMDRWGIHGRGMALYSIAQNAKSAGVVESNLGLGTAILVSFDVNDIGERADQSSWPTVKGSGGAYEVRGPKNIARACVEFALETKGECNVYFGSPSEAVATMYGRVEPTGMPPHAFTQQGLADVPLCMRPAWAHDAREMRDAAQTLGIEMSERTAHRIVRSQIAPLRNVLGIVLGSNGSARAKRADGYANRRLSLSEDDQRELKESLADAFRAIAARYYFELDGDPRIRVDGDVVHVSFRYQEGE